MLYLFNILGFKDVLPGEQAGQEQGIHEKSHDPTCDPDTTGECAGVNQTVTHLYQTCRTVSLFHFMGNYLDYVNKEAIGKDRVLIAESDGVAGGPQEQEGGHVAAFLT